MEFRSFVTEIILYEKMNFKRKMQQKKVKSLINFGLL